MHLSYFYSFFYELVGNKKGGVEGKTGQPRPFSRGDETKMGLVQDVPKTAHPSLIIIKDAILKHPQKFVQKSGKHFWDSEDLIIK